MVKKCMKPGRVMSIDIGSRNLAWCVINTKQWEKYDKSQCFASTAANSVKRGIVNWGKVDLLDDELFCQGTTRKGKNCDKKAKFISKVKNGKPIEELEYACGLHKKEGKYKELPKRNSNTVSKFELHNLLANWLEDSKDWLLKNRYVYIELQLTKNPSMKLISHFIYAWFMFNLCGRNNQSKVEYVAFMTAKYKLSKDMYDYVGEIESYNYKSLRKKEFRKTEAPRLAEILIVGDDMCNDYYHSIKKKDDLADTLLMCVWQYLRMKRE